MTNAGAMAGLHERELVASATSPATSEPERLWYAARYSDCIESLRAVAPSSVRFLQTAKAYYRMRRYRDCVACLRAGDAYFTDLESSVLGSALAAESCMACGDREGAAAYLDELKQFESADIPGRLRFEIIYAQALGDWSAGKLREADQRMRAAAPADDGQKARAKIIRSWVYAAQERFVEQTTLLVDALLMLQDAPVADVGLIARACWAISAPLREVFLPEPLAILGDVIRKIPWTDDIALEHFQTLRFSGWAYAFRRNYIRSIRQFQEARDVAPSPYYDVLCQFDGAWVSHIAGESLSSSVQADRAFEAASQLDWNKVEGEECVALLVGAEMVAKKAPRRPQNSYAPSKAPAQTYRLLCFCASTGDLTRSNLLHGLLWQHISRIRIACATSPKPHIRYMKAWGSLGAPRAQRFCCTGQAVAMSGLTARSRISQITRAHSLQRKSSLLLLLVEETICER